MLLSKVVNKEFESGYITGASRPLYLFDNKVCGYTPYDLMLYRFGDDTICSKTRISIVDFDAPSLEFLNRSSDAGMSGSLFSNLFNSDYISYYSISETSTTFLISVIRHKERFVGLQNKKTGSTYFVTLDSFAENLGFGKISYFITGTMNNKVLAILEKEDLIEYVEKGGRLDSRLQDLLAVDNGNPIIVQFGF